MTPDANDLCVFAVKRGYIESKEIYCNPLYPTYLSLVEKYQHSPYANGILNNHVAVNPKTDCSLLSDSSEVSFVPMANVQEKTNVVSYDMVAYETVKKGFTVFQRGDLIWAKITPCMQNGKSCIVDKMPTEIGFGSTEFHVIRKRNENVYMPFIWAILSSDDVLKAAQATFSGSAGQQRVSASFIENFPAVLPDYPVQVRLVAELEDKLNLLNGKLQRAYELLHKTPMYLIDRLGLTFDFSATQKITYATTVANIEGVARQFFCETRTEFLRKNSPVLRSKSETRSLASTAPKMEGAAHVKGRVLAWGGAAFAAPPLAFCPWGSSYPSVASPASSAASWAATGSVYSDQP